MEMWFGPPGEWPEQDLVAFSDDFDPAIALAAYRCGVFPMPLDGGGFGDSMGWWSPMERALLPHEMLRVTRSLRRSARRYTTTVDLAFDRVIERCSDPQRADGWIDGRITAVFSALHRAGYVHSVETWDAQGRLVGGLYGVHQHGMFAGESMFHEPVGGTDASKVALVRLMVELRGVGVDLLDVQWLTPHLGSLGAVTASRDEYLRMLDEALAAPHTNRWPAGEASRLTGAQLLTRMEELDA